MKAEELMIGDWVFCTYKQKNYKVAEIKTVADNELKLIVYDDNIPLVFRMRYFEPIPLTEEILKANGIVKHKFAGHIEECYSLYVNPSDEQFILWEETGRYELVLRHIVDNLTYSALRCKVRNVHELQHALRLCGIEKEIVIK